MNIGQRAGYKSIEGMSLNLFSDDELFEIHCATLQVLNETGVRVLAKDAQDIFDGGGCRVDKESNIVKIPPHVVEDAIRSAPSTFVVGGIDPEEDFMLRAGSTISFTNAQLLIDNEIARMIKEVVGGITVNSNDLALEVIQSVGAAGEYVSHEHTYTHFRDLASQNKLIYRGTRDAWQHAGSKDITTRAYEEAKEVFGNFKVKALPEDVVKKMRSIVNEAEEHYNVKLSTE